MSINSFQLLLQAGSKTNQCEPPSSSHKRQNTSWLGTEVLKSTTLEMMTLKSWMFSPFSIPCNTALFKDFGNTFRFTYALRIGYQNAPYHNWLHGFTVFHFIYVLLKQFKLVDI